MKYAGIRTDRNGLPITRSLYALCARNAWNMNFSICEAVFWAVTCFTIGSSQCTPTAPLKVWAIILLVRRILSAEIQMNRVNVVCGRVSTSFSELSVRTCCLEGRQETRSAVQHTSYTRITTRRTDNVCPSFQHSSFSYRPTQICRYEIFKEVRYF
jgi:hypothetical protein